MTYVTRYERWKLKQATEEAKREGLEQGLEQARQQVRDERREVVKKLLAKGVPSETVAEATGFSIEELEALGAE